MQPDRARAPAAALRECVRWYDAALAPELCTRLITAFEQTGGQHVQREPGWREGLDDSAWTELDITPLADAALKGLFFGQIEEYLARYNAAVGFSLPVPISRRLAPFRMKRYRPGSDEKFQLLPQRRLA